MNSALKTAKPVARSTPEIIAIAMRPWLILVFMVCILAVYCSNSNPLAPGLQFPQYSGAWTLLTDPSITLYAGSAWGENDIIAVGEGGAVYHYDGQVWQRLAPFTDRRLEAAWCGPEGTCLVGGVILGLYELVDGGWVPSPGTEGYYIKDVWGCSKSDWYAVGLHGGILRHEESGWSEMESGTSEHLTKVWGTSKEDVFAVGSSGTICHWSGNAWETFPTMTNSWIRDISGRSPTDVYAVGDDGTVLHFDGTEWSREQIEPRDDLRGVWASPSSGVYIASIAGVVYRLDNSTWTAVDDSVDFAPFSIIGCGESDFALIGTHFGRAIYNDTRLTSSWSTPQMNILDAWAQTTSNIIVANSDGDLYRFDGGLWSMQTTPADTRLRSIVGVSPEEIYAAGTRKSIHTRGVIAFYDGNDWESVEIPESGELVKITRLESGEIVAVGEGGSVLLDDAGEWRSVFINEDVRLLDAWGANSAEFYVVGTGASIFRRETDGWIKEDAPPSDILRGIWGVPNEVILAVGSGVFSNYGLGWEQDLEASGISLSDVHGLSEAEAWACGSAGAIFAFDGAGWTGHMTGVTASLAAFATTTDGEILAVGDRSTILLYSGRE